jgi:ATP-dependent helicase/nuclease subunit A
VIGFIISVLTSFLNPDDQVVKAEVNYLYYRKIFPQLKALGKAPEIRRKAENGKRKTGDRRPELETSTPNIENNKRDIENSNRDLETSKRDIETSKRDIETSTPELETSKRDLEDNKGELENSKGDLEDSKRDLETSKRNLETKSQALGDRSPLIEAPLPEREAVEGSFQTATYEPDIYQQFEEMDSSENELMQFLTSKSFQELIAGKPIPEIIYSICEKFNLFSLTDELAYLQAFVDQISVFERTQASELTSFLNWWQQNGERFTIPVSDSIDAITVLTIHKSKGLEFTHVFVPFFNWSIHPPATPDRAPLLWCKPEVAPFSDMELVPVRYKKDVGDSIFYREFFTEKFNTYIDNLNLMYVVFTRAKAALWVWASYSSSKLTSVGDLLKQALERQTSMGSCDLKAEESVQLAESYDPEKQLLEMGEITVSDEKKKNGKTVTDVRLSEFEFADFRKFLNIKKRGEDFFTRDDKKQSGINKGKLIHEILSLIETTDDLNKAVKRISTEGKLDADKSETMKAELLGMLTDQEIKSWFDGTYRVINERNILTGPKGLKRPDRIMISDTGVVVIDYKSGETESENYKYQLRSYISELKNCGYENVTGFIWYTRQNKRVEV